jgi:hypothetical protein
MKCCQNLLELFDADTECVSHKLSAEENGRKFRLEIPSKTKEEICRIKVDDCLIASNDTTKCDYLFRRCEFDETYFVELKGQGVKHAYKQIKTTLLLLNSKLEENNIILPKNKIFACIVSSKVPKGVNVQELKENFRKNHGKRLEISSTSPYTWILKND